MHMKIINKIPYLFFTIILSSPIFSSTSFADKLPDLPVALKNGTGLISQNIIYIGLGSTGNSWYKLDLNENKKWEKIADFPGTPRDQAIAINLNNDIYIFGGAGKENIESETISSLTDVYR
ncbi:TPA: N-acetylneuraminic acid mutarotase, partial [Morganella morganii]|nr:N-acetylneuraminic acid mutarotase [Morganella morganii]